MLEDIKRIAEREGWSQATQIAVLAGVLEEIANSEQHWTAECVLRAIEERAHG